MKTQEHKNIKTKKHKNRNCFNVLMFSCFNDQTGQSLVEVLIALGVFVLGIATIGFLVLDANVSTRQGVERTQATLLAKEGLEAVRSIRDADFDNLTVGTHGIALSGNQWTFSGSSDTQDQFTRTIIIEDLGVKEKKITANVNWQFGPQRFNSVSLVTYLNNWPALIGVPTSCDEYAIQEGYITGTCRQNTQQCDNYGEIYLSEGDVYCTGGPSEDTCCALPSGGGFCSGTATACTVFNTSPTCLAQAGCSWDGGVSGSSPTWSTTWGTYYDWESGNDVNGTSPTTGGNPTDYKDIIITRNSGAQTASGYWQQSFITTATNPDTATINFDWSIKSYNGTYLTSYIIYVFVDNFSGAPTIGNQVWSQTITSTTDWATVSNLNVVSKLTATGTYYIKLVARRIKPSGNPPKVDNTVGWDNVSLNWTKNNSCSGTATVCDTFIDQLTCQAQGGCSWSGQ